MNKMTKGLLLPGGFLIFLVLMYACGGEKAAAPVDPARPVGILKVSRQEIGLPLSVAGRLAAEKGIRLGFKLGGVIRSIPVREGDRVKKGQLLAMLDQRETAAQHQVVQAAFDKAERDLKRVESLHHDRAATDQQLQDVRTARDVARGQLDTLNYNLSTTQLRAEGDGLVLRRLAEPGEVIGPGMPVIYYALGSHRWVLRAALSEGQILEVSMGAAARIQLSAYPDRFFPGRVTEVAAGLNPGSGGYEVEILLEETDARLLSGFVGRADIEPARKSSAWQVPLESLVNADGRQADLFVVETGRALRKPVNMLHLSDAGAVVQGDLGEEILVVVKGATSLKSGDAVVAEGSDQGGRP